MTHPHQSCADVPVPTRTTSIWYVFSVGTLWNNTNTWMCGPANGFFTPNARIALALLQTHLFHFTKTMTNFAKACWCVIPSASASSVTDTTYRFACCVRPCKKAPDTSAFLSSNPWRAATCKTQCLTRRVGAGVAPSSNLSSRSPALMTSFALNFLSGNCFTRPHACPSAHHESLRLRASTLSFFFQKLSYLVLVCSNWRSTSWERFFTCISTLCLRSCLTTNCPRRFTKLCCCEALLVTSMLTKGCT